MTPDFYYGEMLRWSFGFENPNKAAVIFACLIPLLWAVWLNGFRIRSRRWRVFVLMFAAVGFLVAWACLLLTFSRGGLVAAIAGMSLVTGWALIEERRQLADGWMALFRRAGFWLSGILVALVVATALVLGMGSRSMEAIGEDASVDNRIDLWAAALQMAYENPAGFGAGRSGAEFMQWYQAVERTEGYRTMVNSYLTFLVEYGWVTFALVMLIVAALWAWSWPNANAPHLRWRIALWASLAAFLISGIFSTTMEEPLVWILPVLAMLGIIVMRLTVGKPLRVSIFPWAVAMGAACLLLATLLFMGMSKSLGDPLERIFDRVPEGQKNVVAMRSKSAKRETILSVYPDDSVLGPDWGKLLRTLALQTGREIWVGDARGSNDMPFDVMLVGSNIMENHKAAKSRRVFLLAPSAGDITLTKNTTLLLPEIDEDGRSSFWQERVETMKPTPVKMLVLHGVGTRVEWAWGQVIEAINEP